MNKTRLNKIVILGFIISLFSVLSFSHCFQYEGFSLESMLILCNGGLTNIDQLIVVYVLIHFLPYIILYLILADFLKEDLMISGIYVFTRTAKRTRWYYKKILQLLLGCMLYSFLYFVIPLFSGIIMNIGIGDMYIFLTLVTHLFLISVLSFLMWTLGVNLLVLIFGEKTGILVVLLLQMASLALLFLPGRGHGLLIQMLPTTQSMLTFHNDVWLTVILQSLPHISTLDTIPHVNYGFPLIESYLYLVIIIAVEITFGNVVVRRIEIL